jgi:hypothetical protein
MVRIDRMRATVPAGALLFALAFGGMAQPVADKPSYMPGDAWLFQQTSTPADANTKWSRTIVEIASGDQIRVRNGNGTVETYDAAMNFMPQGLTDYTRILARYPMKVGDEWPVTRKFENPSTAETGTAKVAAFEEITVPAGTYKCYRVDVDASLTNRTYKEQRLWKRWYCPDVKWIAKEILETRTFNRDGPGSGTTIATSELVKYTPAK